MAAMQKPSIGRIVHLCWSGQRIAAVITYVHSDTCINVQPCGGSRGPDKEQTSVVYEEETAESAAQANAMTTKHYTWSWPPRV